MKPTTNNHKHINMRKVFIFAAIETTWKSRLCWINWGEDALFLVVFGLLFGDLDFNVLPAHFQEESSDSLEDISSLKLLDVQMQYWFTWEIPKVSLSRQQKTWRNTSQKNPRGTGNVSKWLWSLLVFRDPNIGQHAHMIRIILVYVLCTDCS